MVTGGGLAAGATLEETMSLCVLHLSLGGMSAFRQPVSGSSKLIRTGGGEAD